MQVIRHDHEFINADPWVKRRQVVPSINDRQSRLGRQKCLVFDFTEKRVSASYDNGYVVKARIGVIVADEA